MSNGWYEIWADGGSPTPYVLIVAEMDDEQGVVVIDPQNAKRIVHRAADYESAKLWLLEDEYERVEGRMAR